MTDGLAQTSLGSGMADGMASEPGSGMASGRGSTQHPGPAPQHSACRRVAVVVDGSIGSAPALRQAASQARQRNATLDVICLLPEDADARTVALARVRLGEFSRRACPYGMGAPVRFRVEYGVLDTVLPVIQAEVELLVTAAYPGTGPDRGPARAVPRARQTAPSGQAASGQAAAGQAPTWRTVAHRVATHPHGPSHAAPGCARFCTPPPDGSSSLHPLAGQR